MSQPTQSNLPNKVLVVDDDPSVAQGLEEPLARQGVKIDKAPALETAFYMFNTQRYDVVMIEIEFAPLAGLALVQKWRAHEMAEKRSTAFVMLSGNKTLGNNEGLIRELGDLEVITKPMTAIQVLPYLSRGLATKKRIIAYLDLKSKIIDFYEKNKDFDKAAEQVQKRLPELGSKGMTLLLELYEKGNRLEQALSVVSPMLDRDPNNIALLNTKARILMRLGKFQDARGILEKADTLAPENIDRLTDMASAYLHLRDPDASVKAFKQVLLLTPERPEMKFEMFSLLYDHGFDEHAVAFGKDVAKPMEIVRHYNNKGVMLSKDGNTDGALTEYQRALRFFPKFKENYRIHFNIALANIQLKTREGLDAAAKNLKTCLELEPEFEKAKKTLETVERSLTPKKKAG